MDLAQMYDYVKLLRRRRVPGQLVIQITDRCNASCPQCGMRVSEPFKRSDLNLDDVRRILDSAVRRGIRIVSFTGGEPLLFTDTVKTLIEHAGSVGIEHIRTGTNGYLFMNSDSAAFESKIERLADKLARTPLRNFWISVDSAVPAIHERMRGFPGVIAGIEKALPIFHRYGIYPSANVGINRNIGGEATQTLDRARHANDASYLEDFSRVFGAALERFCQFVADLGFTIISACYPMSVEEAPRSDDLSPVYGATSRAPLVRFSDEEKAALFRGMMNALKIFRSKIRMFSPASSLYALHRQYSANSAEAPYPCRGGRDFFFVDAKTGGTFPCGYRGADNLGKFWDLPDDPGDSEPSCLRCDWECFRDPSELLGPFLQGAAAPMSILKRFKRDREYFRLWFEDLRYYRACGMFNGRRPPDMEKLARFASGGHG